MQACPSAVERSNPSARSWTPGVIAALDRQPDIVAKLNNILATPGAPGTYIDNNCKEYVVRGVNDTKVVASFLGRTPAQQPGLDGALLCSDFEGVYHGFYKFAPRLCFCTALRLCHTCRSTCHTCGPHRSTTLWCFLFVRHHGCAVSCTCGSVRRALSTTCLEYDVPVLLRVAILMQAAALPFAHMYGETHSARALMQSRVYVREFHVPKLQLPGVPRG